MFPVGMSDKGKKLYSFYQGAFSEGLTGTKAYFLARKLKLETYAKTDMLADLRTVYSARKVSEPMKFTPKRYKLGEGLYKESSKEMKEKFATVMRISYTDEDTKEKVEQYITVRHQKILSTDDLGEAARIAYEKTESPRREITIMAVQGFYWEKKK